MRAVAVAALVLALAACGGDPGGSPQRVSHPVALAGTTWRLVALQGRVPPGGEGLTLAFAPDGRVSGDGGCNRFSGTFRYEAATGHLELADLGATKRACAEPARNEVEAVYFAALSGVTEATGDPEGRLVLTGAGADLVLEVGGLQVAPPAESAAP